VTACAWGATTTAAYCGASVKNRIIAIITNLTAAVVSSVRCLLCAASTNSYCIAVTFNNLL
jgi:hypothetical protein